MPTTHHRLFRRVPAFNLCPSFVVQALQPKPTQVKGGLNPSPRGVVFLRAPHYIKTPEERVPQVDIPVAMPYIPRRNYTAKDDRHADKTDVARR